MTAMVVYESMFGNTRQIAEAIGDGLAKYTEVRVEPVSNVVDPAAELVVIGAPTHAHSLPRAGTREDAAKWADDPEKHLALEPEAAQPGVREWRMRHHNSRPAVPSECFVVDFDNVLVDVELDRAREWGDVLGRAVFARQATR